MHIFAVLAVDVSWFSQDETMGMLAKALVYMLFYAAICWLPLRFAAKLLQRLRGSAAPKARPVTVSHRAEDDSFNLETVYEL